MNIFDMIAATVSPEAQANVQAERMIAAGPKMPAPMSMADVYAYGQGGDPGRAARAAKVAQMRASEARMQQPVTTTEGGIQLEKELINNGQYYQRTGGLVDLIRSLAAGHDMLNDGLDIDQVKNTPNRNPYVR